jgi:hypothetical protein
MAFSLVNCSICDTNYLKDNRHIKENIKLGNKFYCSLHCFSKAKNKQLNLICDNPNCQNRFNRIPSQLSIYNFCSSSCGATFNNKGRVRNKLGINGSTQKGKVKIAKPYYCLYCGNRRFAGRNYCSMKCWGKAHEISKHELINSILFLSLQLGRAPTERECKHSTACRKYFGSWNSTLLAAGLIPHRSLNQKMYQRRKCIAKDGHTCDSVSELIIDNWLTEHNIQHLKAQPYPTSKHIADWSLDNKTFIEYFGLANDSRRYDKEIIRKWQLCTELGIKLIEVYSKDLFPKSNLITIFKNYVNSSS